MGEKKAVEWILFVLLILVIGVSVSEPHTGSIERECLASKRIGARTRRRRREQRAAAHPFLRESGYSSTVRMTGSRLRATELD